jgi:TP901 family phage tail tape measure protein
VALIDTAKMLVELNLAGNFSRNINKIGRDLNRFDSRIDRTQNRANQVGQHIGLGIRNLGRLAVAGAGAIGTITAASLKLAGDFEAQLNTINTIARETPEGLSRIGDQIRQIARDTGTPLEDLTQGYYDLLSAGIDAADAQKVLVAANKLAIGGLGTTAETVDLLTTAINTYGIKASKAATIADIFAVAIERGKVTAAELAGSFAQIAPIAAASGIEIREVAAGFARLTASGVPAAEAATQMRQAIVSLTRRTGDLKKLEKQTGRNYLKLAGKKGLVFALQQLRTDADKAGVPLINLLGRVDGLNFLLATTGPNFDKYNADLAATGNAAGTAAAQMAERQKGLNFQLGRLKALAKDAGIIIGSILLPKITPLLEKFNKFVNLPENQDKIAKFGDAIAGLFSEENIGAGIALLKDGFKAAQDAAPAIIEGAKLTASVVSAAVALFKTLPPDLQKLAIAGLAINKLTGGLVTNIAGGLISSVLKQLVSGVVNVTGATVIVKGPQVPGAGGTPPVAGKGGGGAVGGALKAVGAVTIIGMAAGAAAVIAGVTRESDNRIINSQGNIARTVADGNQRLAIVNSTIATLQGRTDAYSQRQLAALIAVRDQLTNQITPQDQEGALKRNFNPLLAATQIDTAQTKAAIGASAIATGAVIGATAAATRGTISSSGAMTQGAVRGVAPPIVSAIYANRPNISVSVRVQATQVTKSVVIQERYGAGNGSYGGGMGGH